MKRFCNRVASPSLAAAVLVLAASACGGPPGTNARSGADERLPADGTAGGPPASSVKTKTITKDEWTRITSNHLKPACDARSGAGKADEPALRGAGDVIATWMAFIKQPKRGPKTADGRKLGGGVEPTRVVNTLGMTCSATKNTVEVNGVEHPFDIAWVVSGRGQAPTLTGGMGAGNFAMIEALSLKEKKVVLAKVYVPGDGNDDTDDTIVISDLGAFMPENPDEPIVRATGAGDDPIFETFVFTKGATAGLAFQVPKQDPLGRARYLAVGKFAVP
ncbi:MAG: hypothetical protein JWP97_487 [Labilithrix sp.]|nr:hypothetical protein [Labilithrix sp.]